MTLFPSLFVLGGTEDQAEVEDEADCIIGLNFNCVEGVIPTCCSEENPAKYEPISCGDCKLLLLPLET